MCTTQVAANNIKNMGRMSYNKGFRLNPRRVCVLRLRKRFNFFFLRLYNSCKLSYGEAIQLLKKVVCRKSSSGGLKRNNSNTSSTRSLVKREEKIKGQDDDDCKMRSCARSNSFYAEAIADCLEFIKRTSVSSMDQSHQDPINS